MEASDDKRTLTEAEKARVAKNRRKAFEIRNSKVAV